MFVPEDDGQPAERSRTDLWATEAVQEAIPRTSEAENDDSPARASTGLRIGLYTLVERLGFGGMGEVWLAEQSVPVKRRVALKLIKPGVASPETIARFEAERQALAMMSHPNIARILDAGKTGDDQPYFVMELVSGLPLTDYCDRNQLSVEERLKLFLDICSGVQHAHQKGIIHRDLKPGNIIVDAGEAGGQPVAKIIDFGLAKALDSKSRLTPQLLMTEIGQILGTLKYMSPEQASLENNDIDTRADIYALGVILYELLTGSTPLDDRSLKAVSPYNLLEMIRETDPVKPSNRLANSSGAELSTIIQVRRTDSLSLKRVLLGDLDWIVLRALEKERDRRYSTASGFAADIRRHLAGEPVEARPPSFAYRVNKFVRRNRLEVMAAGLLLATLIVGVTSTFFQWRRAEARTEEAIQAQVELRSASEHLEKLNAENILRLDQVETVNRLLVGIFEDLDLNRIRNDSIPIEEALADRLIDVGRNLDSALRDDPRALARLQHQLALTLSELGRQAEAATLARSALAIRQTELGQYALDTVATMRVLGSILVAQEKFEEAFEIYEDALRGFEDHGLEADWPMIEVMIGLAFANQRLGRTNEVESNLKNAVALCQQGKNRVHPVSLTATHALAVFYVEQDRMEQALPLLEKVVRQGEEILGPADVITLRFRFSLADALVDLDRINEALPEIESLLSMQREILGADHPDTLGTSHLLSSALTQQGEYKEAANLLEDLRPRVIRRLGRGHRLDLVVAESLALLQLKLVGHDTALPLLEEVAALSRAKHGSDHLLTLGHENSLAGLYYEAENQEKAAELWARILERLRLRPSPDSLPLKATVLNNLAGIYYSRDDLQSASEYWEQAYALKKDLHGPDHSETLNVLSNLCVAYGGLGLLERAISLQEQGLDTLVKKHSASHPVALQFRNNLAGNYFESEQLDKAIREWEQTLDFASSVYPRDHPNIISTIRGLARAHQLDGSLQTSLKLNREVYSILRQKRGPTDPLTLASSTRMARDLMLQGKFESAKSYLNKALPDLEKTLGPQHPETLEARTCLALIYANYGASFKEFEPLEDISSTLLEVPPLHKLEGEIVGALVSSGRLDLANRLVDRRLSELSKVPQADLLLATKSLLISSQAFLEFEHAELAEKLSREALMVLRSKRSASWLTHWAEYLLGAALLDQLEVEEAEPYLLAGFEGFRRKEGQIPKPEHRVIGESLESLIRLYRSIDRPAEVDRLQQLRKQVAR